MFITIKSRLAGAARPVLAAVIAWSLLILPGISPQAQADITDYHFRAGDGGGAGQGGSAVNLTSENGGTGTGVQVPYVTAPIAGAPASGANGVVYGGPGSHGSADPDGKISFDAGQAGGQNASAGGQGGSVVIDLGASHRVNNQATTDASRYIFTAGDGRAGAGGDISLAGGEVTFHRYSSMWFKSGANANGGRINFQVNTLNTYEAGSSPAGGGTRIDFEQVPGGGRITSKIGTLNVGRTSAISYQGTSSRYNTIDDRIYLGLAANLTLYGTAGSRYNEEMGSWMGGMEGNYSADGAVFAINNNNGGSPVNLNLQAGKITAGGLDVYVTAHQREKYMLWNGNLIPNWKYALVLNNSSGMAGLLDIRDLTANDMNFTFSTSGVNTMVDLTATAGESFALIQGNGYLESAADYGTFLKTYGATAYLFEVYTDDEGDLWLKNLGPDGGFTHFIKSYYEGHAAAATTAIRGGQFVSDSVIENAKHKSRLNMTTSSLTVGTSTLKTKTGSHVDSDNYNAALSGAYLFELGPGEMLFGAFLEAGKGRYDTYHNYNPAAPQSNNGKADYFGGGAFAHYSFPLLGVEGFHVEAAIRTGKIDNKYDSIFNNAPVYYRNKTNYYGGHIGLGKAFDLTDQDILDVYAKGFYTVLDAGGVKTSARENVEFDKVESVVSRVGARYTRNWTDCFQTYIGGAWEREYQGDVDGTYAGKHYDVGAELKGDSAFGEIGFNLQPSYLPLEIELSAFGKGGRQEGVGGSLALKYTY